MALDKIILDLYVYDGTENSFSDTDLRYTITKKRINSQTNITVEIAELVRDYFIINFDNDYNVFTKWVSVVVSFFEPGDQEFTFGSPAVFNYNAFDGYGYFEDGTNPELSRDALISANNIYLPEDVTGKLPIYSEGVGKVIIGSNTTQITDNGNSNQKIQYLTIPANSSSIQIYGTDDSTLLKTILITNICEPKYTPFKITFLNKYGCFEDLYFFKRTNEKLNVTDETFKKNTIQNSSASYSTSSSQQERYAVNGKTSLTLNTGFIVEDMNQTIEELFLSEQVWIRYENKTLPVMPTSKSMEFKTSLNDKLANYTIDFNFAFDKINNVR